MESKIRGHRPTLLIIDDVQEEKFSSKLLISKGVPFNWNPTGQTQEAFAERQRQRLLATPQERKKV